VLFSPKTFDPHGSTRCNALVPDKVEVQKRRRKREQRARWRQAALARETPQQREARLAAKREAQRARRAALSALRQGEREKSLASQQEAAVVNEAG
jgi:hypothetical protein